MNTPGPLQSWSNSIEQVLQSNPQGTINRAVALESVSSTQDIAVKLANGQPGLMVLAGSQTQGRGTQGKTWHQQPALALACSFALASTSEKSWRLSLAGALAIRSTASTLLGDDQLLGLRWPNDIVLCEDPVRKLAGVLVEQFDSLYILGIGTNILQQTHDWPRELQSCTVSLAQLGYQNLRIAVAQELVLALNRMLLLSDTQILQQFALHDAITGKAVSLVWNNHQYTGVVRQLDPLGSIVLEQGDGMCIEIPAMSCSMVRVQES